jgi:hypothetical protein
VSFYITITVCDTTLNHHVATSQVRACNTYEKTLNLFIEARFFEPKTLEIVQLLNYRTLPGWASAFNDDERLSEMSIERKALKFSFWTFTSSLCGTGNTGQVSRGDKNARKNVSQCAIRNDRWYTDSMFWTFKRVLQTTRDNTGQSKEPLSNDERIMSLSDAEKRNGMYLNCDFCWRVTNKNHNTNKKNTLLLKISGTAIKGRIIL